MNKIVVIVLMVSSLVYGFDGIVKKSDITILINDKAKSFKVGDKFTLTSGDLICFKSGEGRVVINGEDYKISLNKNSTPCKVLPKADNTPMKLSWNGVIKLFSPTKEQELNGMSVRSTKMTKTKKTYVRDKQAQYIAYQSNQWVLPVTLKVYDTKHNIVMQDKNEENVYTSFVIPMKILKNGYIIEIKNGFDDTVADTLVDFK